MKYVVKKYFIPHEHNQYQPHFWRTTSFRFLSIFVVAIFLSVFSLSYIAKNTGLSSQVIPGVLVSLTNQERQSSKLSELVVNQKLVSAAQKKAQDMFQNQYFAHVSPTGVTPWNWFDAVSYEFLSAGENLAIHYTDSSAVQSAWLNSPGHKANIVSPKYTEIGIAAVDGMYQGYPTTIVVQMFGRPAAKISPAISQLSNESNTNNIPSSVLTQPQDGQSIKGVTIDEKPASISPVVKKVILNNNSLANRKESNTSKFTIATNANPNITVIHEDSKSETSKTIEVENIDKNIVEVSTKKENSLIHVDNTLREKLITNPSEVLKTIYILLAFFVGIAMALLVFVEIKKQHLPSILKGVAVLILMFGLYKFSKLFF